ncbi:MAG: succinylglutamate desuccinylase/aspartoacylase family protein [Haliscomenobacter sp.]|nr:succinylglutamate desuccinylase/aspartoacylase family protein [Haliscomenobacter sp.]
MHWGVHGNEPAGVMALEELMIRLEAEPYKNPGFRFWGSLLAIRGNLPALEQGKRFILEDLNRAWTPQGIALLYSTDPHTLNLEQQQMLDMLQTIRGMIAQVHPEQVFFLDLHTNSASGGIFGLPAGDAYSRKVARGLHAPVVNGMLEAVEGSMLRYFLQANWGVPVSGLAFEAGQHEDPASVRRALAATINVLRATGCVRSQDVDNEHDALLMAFSKGLPAVSEIIWRHPVEPEDQFRMEPGFQNFDPVRIGQRLATDRNGPVLAKVDARILMPLYQAQGEDGFFLIRD